MGKIVDHIQRKKDILKRALELFSSEGYSNVTYTMLALRCGVQRTILYNYFPTKRDIFEGAIKSVTDELGVLISQIMSDNSHLTYSAKIQLLFDNSLDLLNRNIKLLQTIHEYLIVLQRQDIDVSRRVRVYTIMERRILINLVRDAVKKGEFREVDCVLAGDTLYGLLETASLRISICDTANLTSLKQSCKLIVEGLKKSL